MQTDSSLQGKRIAVLMTDGVEQVEYTGPRQFLEEHGAQVTLISPKQKGEQIQGFNHLSQGERFPVDMNVREAKPDAFDALVLPGGVANPDQLRLSREAIGFIRDFARADKPIAAICHGPWTLIDADIAHGKHLTSWPSLQQDLRNAGAQWTDEPVVVDGKLVTSRKPDDIPAFDEALLNMLTGAGATAQPQTGQGLGHEQQDEQDLGPNAGQPGANNVSEAKHNVQEEPGSQLTG